MAGENGRRIEDAGETIGGARKDFRKERMTLADLDSMTAAEAFELVRKDAVWPQPDWPALIAEGVDPRAAALLKILRDRLAAKPRRDTPEGRAAYVRMLGFVRDAYSRVRREADFKEARNDLFYGKLDWVNGQRSPAVRELLFSVYKGRSEPFQVSAGDLRKAEELVGRGWPEAEPAWRKGVHFVPTKGGFAVVKANRVLQGGFVDVAAAEAWLKSDAEARAASGAEGPKLPKSRPHLDRLVRSGLDEPRGGRSVAPEDFLDAFGFRAVEFGDWLPDGERQQVLDLAYDALHSMASALDLDPKALSLGGTLAVAFGSRGKGGAAAHYEPGRRVFNITRLSGAGSAAHEWFHAFDHWTGEVGTDAAGRGEPVGGTGWYKPTRSRAAVLQHLPADAAQAWDALMQAMWSRPRTKDEALADLRKRREELLGQIAKVEDAAKRAAERGPVVEASYLRQTAKWLKDAKELHLPAIDRRTAETEGRPVDGDFGRVNSDYLTEAAKLSGHRADGYWLRPTEMGARAFEASVFDRLAERGARDDYLVHGVEGDRYADPMEHKGNPYPAGAERKAIAEAMERLVRAMAPVLERDLGSERSATP